MRPLLIASLFVVLGFAGCIDSDLLNPDDETGSSQDTFQADPSMQEMPERSFEPELILDAPELIELQVEQGTQVNFTFNITDLHDYPFPVTFVDWNLTYSREPNPVAEGDAHDLPAEWNRTLFAEDFHFFTLAVDDGQGFKANKTIVIKVGDPPIPESGVIGEDTGGGNAVFEPMAIEESFYIDGSCGEACSAFGTNFGHSLPAKECVGLHTGVNGIGCAWVELPVGAAGATWTVTANTAPDVDVEFLDLCAPHARKVGDSFRGFIDALEPVQTGEVPQGARCLMAWTRAADPQALDTPHVTIKVDEFQNAISGEIPFEGEPRVQFIDGPVAPCAGDAIAIAYDAALGEAGYDFTSSSGCPGLLAGPYQIDGDGIWIPIDARYEGAQMDATRISTGVVGVTETDSDCYFLDHMLNIIGEANNGGGPCSGVVPAGAHWVFAYQWDVPAYSMQIDFVLDDSIASSANRLVGETLMEGYTDLGSAWQNDETGICYSKSAGAIGLKGVPGVTYVGHGTWTFQEVNGIPGLQVQASGPTEDAYAGSPAPAGCIGGDATTF